MSVHTNEGRPYAYDLSRKPLGASELLPSLYALAPSSSVYSTSTSSDPSVLLNSSELEPFLTDIAKRFDKDGLEEVLGGVVRSIAFSPGLALGMVWVEHSYFRLLICTTGSFFSDCPAQFIAEFMDCLCCCIGVFV